MTAVADTSPLILLAKVNRLPLLPELYGEVWIPPAVVAELRAKPGPISSELNWFITTSARVRAPRSLEQARTLSVYLGMGEAEAIAIATEIPDALLIMDDAEGRRVAQRLGLHVTGVLGVLIEAKRGELFERSAHCWTSSSPKASGSATRCEGAFWTLWVSNEPS